MFNNIGKAVRRRELADIVPVILAEQIPAEDADQTDRPRVSALNPVITSHSCGFTKSRN